MSRSITLLGPTGSGALVKLINNFICGVQVVALAEGIAMIERSGLDRGKTVEVLANGAPGSPLVKALSVRMTTPDYTPNFRLSLMAKDLAYAIRESNKLSLDLATAQTALKYFENAIATGNGDKDMAAVVEPLREVQLREQ
jgi:3-hydroxyisobutyrate dehydrogenase